MMNLWVFRTSAAVLLGLTVLLASQSSAAAALDSANTAWIMTSTALVLFMTLPGLALFYAGLVRTKNVLSVLMQCFAIACIASLVWFVAGYSLAFSGGNPFVGDLSKVFLGGVMEDTVAGDIPETVFLMFQMTFAIITPALVVGAFAERIKFSAVVWFTVLWIPLVYAPVCHWVWAETGWLYESGVHDFAGGIVVHITAGIAALVAALVIGPRKGFPRIPMPPHNLTLSVTGAGMLWVGWFGFNGGSALAANGDAGMAILATHMSAACGALTWSVLEWIKFGKPSVLGIITGMVAGLGTITPASGFVGPAGAVVIGIAAGIVCFYATLYIKQTLQLDDSLDVMPVHGVGGILGTFLAGIFASTGLGIFSGQGTNLGSIAAQLSVQLQGIVAAIVYTALVSYIIFRAIDALVGLRVNDDEESEGLDIVSHNEKGYDL